MNARVALAPRAHDRLAMPLVEGLVTASPGDVVRLALESSGAWLYCAVEDRLPDGHLVCRAVEAQSWPLIMIDGILPGRDFVIPPDRVLSVVSTGTQPANHFAAGAIVPGGDSSA